MTVLNVGTGQDSTPCPRLSPTRLLSNCRNHSFFSSFCKPGLGIDVHVSVMQTFGFPRLDHKSLSNVLTGLFFCSLLFMLNAPDPFCQLSTDGDSHLCFGFVFQKRRKTFPSNGVMAHQKCSNGLCLILPTLCPMVIFVPPSNMIDPLQVLSSLCPTCSRS